MMTYDSDFPDREVEEWTEIDIAFVQDHCHSAPKSEQIEEEHIDVEAISDEANSGVNEQGNVQGREDGECEERRVKDKEVVVVDSSSEFGLSSDDEEDQKDEDRKDSKDESSGDEDSSTSFSDSSDEAGTYLVRDGGPLEEEQGENEQEVDALDAFPSSGPREVDIAMRPAIELP